MKALITGVSGQDGFYLAELLLSQGAEVVGLTSHRDAPPPIEGVTMVPFDYMRQGEIEHVLSEHAPDLVFNLAARATGQGMFDDPFGMARLNGGFVLDILEAIRASGKPISFCQASSSEMYGRVDSSPQHEKTALHPKSPYGAAKAYAHNLVGIYRQAFGVRASSAILFNHESVRRSSVFVTKKVATGAASIALGLSDVLHLGDLTIQRDWGYAPEYARAMYLMATAAAPEDYVVATGRLNSLRDLCDIAFAHVGLDYSQHVVIDDAYKRPIETAAMCGDATRIRSALGWVAETRLDTIVREMVDFEIARLGRGPRA